MTALIVSSPTFQTVMDITVDELSQGFLKSGLPQRIAKEGTGFLNDNSNTLDIVRTVIASSNMERLVARSYIASKPVLDHLYNGDTLFLFATLMSGTGAQQNPAVMYAFKMFEADFIKTYNEQTNDGTASLITDPMNTYVSVFQDMDFLALMPTIIGSASVRQLLPYNSSTAEFPINDVCYQDTVDMLDAAKDGKDWAIQMMDSNGKIPSGVLKGNMNFLGNMDQCTVARSDIKANEVIGNIRRTSPRYPRSVGSTFCRAIISNGEMELIEGSGVNGRITWGLCVPETCTGSDVYGLLKLDAFDNATANVQRVECLQESDITQDKAAIITLSILSFLVFLVFSGTTYVAMETRGIIGETHELAKDEGFSSEIASKTEESKEHNGDLKDVHVLGENTMNTNGNAVPEKYVLNTESEKTTLNITPDNNVEQSNNVSNGGMSTNHELPTPESGKEKLTKRKESIFIKIIKAFALQMNIPTILSGKTPPNAVTCINGIRFISVTWVVLCHSFSHGLTRHADKVWPIVNAQDLLKLPERFTFQAIISGGSPVDTFLLLSGVLLTYTQLKHLERLKAKLTGSTIGRYVFCYFFHRILRLTPVYMLVLLIYATLTIHMANGPLMPVELESMQYCKDNWWTNLLYINNLVKADEQCMGWSWYMAIDMQFYIVSLGILFLMMAKLGVGIGASVALMLGSMGIAAWKQYIYNGTLLSSILGFLVFLVFSGTTYVAMETRGIIGETHELAKDEGFSSEIAGKTDESTEHNGDLKDVHVLGENTMNTNGNAVPEKYVLNTESENTTLNITHVNNVEQSNNGSNGGMSTNHELPTPQSGKEKLTKRTESIFIKIIKAFALQMNIPTILSGKTPPNAVTCINGIRFISVTWVVLCHSFSHGLTRHADKVWPIVNAQDLLKLPERFTFQAIISGGSPVDTFLLLSGVLLTYTQLKHLERLKSKLTGSTIGRYVFCYFFLRILRLTPVYMLVLLIYATLTIHMANGPLMPVELESMQYCKDNWWTNLLYINNLVKADEQCMGWSWYMAIDMQFYIVSLGILFLMMAKLGVGIGASVALMLGSMGIAAWKQYIYNGTLLSRLAADDGYFRYVYIAPWCRISPFMIGLVLGVFLRKRQRKPFKKMIGLAGWTIATLVGLTLKYSKYSMHREGGEPWTRLQNALYESLDRPFWALCVAWVIIACHNHMGGPVNSFLSWSGFVPLSRLTYCTYLIHPVVMLVHGFSRRSLFYLDDYSMLYLIIGHTTMSLMAAFVLATTVEFPLIALLKLFV
ncbi:uncharacterized protein LOC117343323 [Pecten maximus]|uniref:uncharacterized protein LOC117343323 n=2 Tax=Pecten maximus TaxID=6579 RepID=UPI00145811A2|nr:uncharacterized protein LOC117343323 [Pecten maximus]